MGHGKTLFTFTRFTFTNTLQLRNLTLHYVEYAVTLDEIFLNIVILHTLSIIKKSLKNAYFFYQ